MLKSCLATVLSCAEDKRGMPWFWTGRYFFWMEAVIE